MLRHFGELVGQSRTRRAHPEPWTINRPWAEPLAQGQPRPADNIQTKNMWAILDCRIAPGGHDEMGPANPQKLSSVRLAFPWKLLELWDLNANGALNLGLAFTENFQPELMSQAMRLRFLGRGALDCPHEAPTLRRGRPSQSSNRRYGSHREPTAGSQGLGNDDKMSEKMPLRSSLGRGGWRNKEKRWPK